jgi:hypothetical protein
MARLQNDTIVVINEHLFKAVVLSLIGLFVGAFLCMVDARPSLDLALSGFAVKLRRADTVFIAALLVVNVNVYNVYKRVICEIGESANHGLLSLLGMIMMFATTIVLFLERMFAYRFALVAAFVICVALKNRKLYRDLLDTALGHRVNIWYQRARYSSVLAMAGAIIFFLMFNQHINRWWLTIWVRGHDIDFTPLYYEWAPLVFYAIFCLHAFRLFLTDGDQFTSDAFQAEITEACQQR